MHKWIIASAVAGIAAGGTFWLLAAATSGPSPQQAHAEDDDDAPDLSVAGLSIDVGKEGRHIWIQRRGKELLTSYDIDIIFGEENNRPYMYHGPRDGGDQHGRWYLDNTYPGDGNGPGRVHLDDEWWWYGELVKRKEWYRRVEAAKEMLGQKPD